MRTITEIHDQKITDIKLLTIEEINAIEKAAMEGKKAGLSNITKEQFLAIKVTKRLLVWNRS
jgi:hypothetical protein